MDNQKPKWTQHGSTHIKSCVTPCTFLPMYCSAHKMVIEDLEQDETQVGKKKRLDLAQTLHSS